MKKYLYIFVAFFFFSSVVFSQVDSVYYGVPPIKEKKKKNREKPPINWKENTSFGGNFMLWFGSTTYVYLSPTVNYAVTPKFNVGLGAIYHYYKDPFYSTSIYGLHSYALYYITNNLFAKVQYDHLLQPVFYSPYPNEKIWLGYLWLGGGFRQPLGDNVSLFTSILWNVNQTTNSYYPNPFIQIGILAGF